MKLFELFATLGIDASGFNSGLSKAQKGMQSAEKKIKEFAKGAKEAAEKAVKALDKISTAAANVTGKVATGVGAAGAAFAGLATKAMDMAGELEQQLGGSEAVFGEYAQHIQEYADNAFYRMGLSTSEYLSTANQMASLFQGSGFSEGESFEMTTQAMQRAADVASIMGISIKDAMYSIQGAAKGNFAMMDNLGVAVNDTAIKNYAAAKGIKTASKEMTTQEKVGIAMQMFLEQTAKYTGNYTKENETLAGSLQTAKAAMKNFMSGRGSPQDVIKYVKSAGKVISENLTELLPNLTSGLIEIAEGLAPELPALFDLILPSIVDGATAMLQGLFTMLPQLMQSAMRVAPKIKDGLSKLVNTVLGGAPAFVKTASELFHGLMDGFMSFLPQIGQLAQEIGPALLMGILEFKADFLLVGFQVISSIAQGLADHSKEVTDKISDIVTQIGTWIADNAGDLIANGFKILQSILDGLTTTEALESISNGIKAVVDELINWISTPGNLSSLITAAFDIAIAIVNGILDPENLEKVSNAAGDIISELVSGIWDGLSSVTQALAGMVAQAIENSGIGRILNGARQGLTNFGNSLGLTNFHYTQSGTQFSGGGGGFATGLDYVPYDNFSARLHKGETVLPRFEAEAYRQGKSGNNAVDWARLMQAVSEAVREGLSGMSIDMNGERVGDVVTRRVAQNIANNARAGRYA